MDERHDPMGNTQAPDEFVAETQPIELEPIKNDGADNFESTMGDIGGDGEESRQWKE